jgi:hypothetical protein
VLEVLPDDPATEYEGVNEVVDLTARVDEDPVGEETHLSTEQT